MFLIYKKAMYPVRRFDKRVSEYCDIGIREFTIRTVEEALEFLHLDNPKKVEYLYDKGVAFAHRTANGRYYVNADEFMLCDDDELCSVCLTNYDELVEELTEMLIHFDVEGNTYQTDVYLYLDEENKGTLDTYINVGGNSWLNDNHITVYRDKPHYEDRPDCTDEEYEEFIRSCYYGEYQSTAEDALWNAINGLTEYYDI